MPQTAETVEVGGEQVDDDTPTATVDDTNAGAGDGGEGAGEPSVNTSAPTETWDNELITKEDFESLKGDPDKLLKHFHSAYTKKTQGLSEQRKFFDNLKANPQGMIRALAERAGLKIAEAAKEKKPEVVEEVRAELAELFGDDAANKMIPAVQKVASKIIEETVGPLKETVQAQVIAARAREADLVMDKIHETYPDYDQHETAILELCNKYPPAAGVDAFEYMSNMYKLATYDKAEGSGARRAIDKMQKSVRSDKPNTHVPGNNVSPSPTGPLGFKEAAALAKRGIRVAD